ncbi:mitochondrial carrier domain-containing protein [Filobasidium floriforme]|uniref:mitochondrial carrier domain-containing protein n=1 Tax=Filobasidium floriforme TaxID=5210 RepID=UPI001E8D8218|nr:mitochondrial carrier domain-containing protein [Filobasidium floriforme]KAH8085776.1 mitochondrial carrier domain-containing protein [Filobasidium floriforme]
MSTRSPSGIVPQGVPVSSPKPAILLPQLSLGETFLCGGLAGCAAVTVSNVPEVMKTRLQLQGELMKTSDAPKVYANVFDVFKKTWRNEGIRGLQRGLVPAYAYQVLLNGSRLGFYEPIRQKLNVFAGNDPKEAVFWSAVSAGSISGMIGATLGNPLFLIKARMQAYSPALPIGTQHAYRNSIHALSSVVKNEGWMGLSRGVGSAMLRTAMGSSVQLPSYNYAKSKLVSNGLMSDSSYWTYLVSSSFSGICVCLMMQPADTALTRVYNRKYRSGRDCVRHLIGFSSCPEPTYTDANGRIRGALYSNPFDCLWKTLKTEGFLGWYKGTTAHFLRIAPHTVITLVANELILEQYKLYKSR